MVPKNVLWNWAGNYPIIVSHHIQGFVCSSKGAMKHFFGYGKKCSRPLAMLLWTCKPNIHNFSASNRGPTISHDSPLALSCSFENPHFFFSTLCNFSHWVLGVQRPFIDASHWEHTCTPFQIFWKTGKQWLATCRAHLVITFLCSWTLGCLKGYHKHTLERRKRKEGATGQGIVFGAAPAERNHWA